MSSTFLLIGLRNDSEQETFPFDYGYTDHQQFSPVQFIKIVPVAAWGNNFNFSIWYVELRGILDLPTVKMANQLYHEQQRRAAWRLCLKFLKGEQSVQALLPAIEEASGFSHEAPLLQALYSLTVEKGDFSGVESLLKESVYNQNLFDEYIKTTVPYQCQWERLDRQMTDSTLGSPGKRGGHQMCWDPMTKRVYLFGGWDGNQDLADFWMYDVSSASWSCLSQDTRLYAPLSYYSLYCFSFRENGPGPRSCHKICIHGSRRLLYVFGRFVEQDSRTGAASISLASECYQYDLEAHVWTLVSENVHAQGGPFLLYDHQMAVDEDSDLIYVFGGRIINTTSNLSSDLDARYSGLYVYDIKKDTWKCIRPDAVDKQPAKTPALRSRIGHSMIFHPPTNQLYIFAGQRNKDYLADSYAYDIPTDTVIEFEKDTSRVGGPDAGFTQRSTVDVTLGEIYLFTGLLREKPSSTTNTSSSSTVDMQKNSFWVYSLTKKEWQRVDQSNEAEWPCPRFAHQLVYDPSDRVHYLFGGNPGEPGAPKRRLDDFWRLKLNRQVTSQDILRRACFLIRRQHYYEMCLRRSGQMEALHFLQEQVAAVVRHDDPKESEEFRSLSGWLFQPRTDTRETTAAGLATSFLSPSNRSPILGLGSYLADPEDQVRLSRQQLFEDLAAFLPSSLRPPSNNLIDLV